MNKLKQLLAAWILALGLPLTTSAQVDVTNLYITGADFSNTAKWEKNSTDDDFARLGIGKLGHDTITLMNTFGGKSEVLITPGTDATHNGNVAAVHSAKNASSYYMQTIMSGMPAGTYTLYFDVYNNSARPISATQCSFGGVTDGDATFTSWAWETHSITMTLTKTNYNVAINLGYTANNYILSNNPVVYFSNLRLVATGMSEADSLVMRKAYVKEQFLNKISRALTLYSMYNYAALNTAIQSAQVVYNNAATIADYENATADLQTAMTDAEANIPNETNMALGYMPNNSFEYGYLAEWTVSDIDNGGVKPNSNADYTTTGVDGSYLYYINDNSTSTTKYIKRTISGLPAGHYRLTALIASDAGNSVTLYAGDNTATVTASPMGASEFAPGATNVFYLDGTQSIEIGATSTKWFKADKFVLTYYTDEGINQALMKDSLNNLIAKALSLNSMFGLSSLTTAIETAQTTWKNSSATASEVSTAIADLHAAIATARASIVNGTDVSAYITNRSFEMNDMTGWTATGSADNGVKTNSGTYETEQGDGTYLFYSGTGGNAKKVSQTVKDLPQGYYALTASVASDSGNVIRIYAGENTMDVVTRGDSVFVNGTTDYFYLADSASIEIGVNSTNEYKADNFTLTYYTEDGVAVAMLKDSLLGVVSKALTLNGMFHLESLTTAVATANTTWNNASATADEVRSAITALYDAIRTARASIKSGTDLSAYITNHSFEINDLSAWTNDGSEASKILLNSEEVETEEGDGSYLYYAGGSNPTKYIKQTIKDLPAGYYKLSAKIASDAGNSVMVYAGDNKVTIDADGNGSGKFVTGTTEYFLLSDSASIEIGATSSTWYKLDNFVLTYYTVDAVEVERLKDSLNTIISDALWQNGMYNLASLTTAVVTAQNTWKNNDATAADVRAAITQLREDITTARDSIKSGTDLTAYIQNNSFEQGSIIHWTSDKSIGYGVFANSGTLKASEGDGTYLYYSGTGSHNPKFIKQTISLLPAGYYTLSVKAASDTGNVVKVFAGENTAEIVTRADSVFKEGTTDYFYLNDSASVEIGASSSSVHKLDNFTLTYYTEEAVRLIFLKDSLLDLVSEALRLNSMYNVSALETAVIAAQDVNRNEDATATEAENAITALREAINDARNSLVDETNLSGYIENNSFEIGDTTGWTVDGATGFGVFANSGEYETNNGDGGRLYYTGSGSGTRYVKQTVKTLPGGYYKLSALVAAATGDSITLYAGDTEVKVGASTQGTADFVTGTTTFFKVEDSVDVEVGAKADVSFKIDNFKLLYYTAETVERELLKDTLQELVTKALSLNAIYASDDLYNAIVDAQNVWKPSTATANEIRTAIADLKEAIENVRNSIGYGAELTGYITNPSFEIMNLMGWTTDGLAGNAEVRKDSVGYVTTNADRDYVYSSGKASGTKFVKQVVKDLPAGYYRLSAMAASDKGNNVTVYAGGKKVNIATTNDSVLKVGMTRAFEVEDYGSIEIGATSDSWFKIDNFRLFYYNTPVVMLKDSLVEVLAKADTLNMIIGNTELSNAIVHGNEVNDCDTATSDTVLAAITRLYEAMVYARHNIAEEADISGFMPNYSFEEGDLTGWNAYATSNYGVKDGLEGTYATTGVWGRYLFYTNDGSSSTDKYIKRQVMYLPPGYYKLKAMAASDNGNKVVIYMGDNKATITTTGSGTFVSGETEIMQLEDSACVEVGATSKTWYKIDDFRFIYYSEKTFAKKNYEAALDTAINAERNSLYIDVTGFERQALKDTIEKYDTVENNIDAYLIATEALDYARTRFTNAYEAYKLFNKKYLKELAYATETLGMTVTPVNPQTGEEAFNAVYGLKVDEDDYVKDTYKDNIIRMSIGEISEWTGTNVEEKTDGEHWSGNSSTAYYGQKASLKNSSAWSVAFNSKSLSLVNGEYMLRVAVRASDDVTLGGYYTLDGFKSDTIKFIVNGGNTGKGITTDGVSSFSTEDTYANGNAGYGWEWRYIPITMDVRSVISVTLVAKATTTGQWVEWGDVELRSKNHMETTYKRKATSSTWGTICLPYTAEPGEGTAIFTVTGQRHNATTHKTNIILDTAATTTMTAGMPYVYKTDAGVDSAVFYRLSMSEATVPVAGQNGLLGTFTSYAGMIEEGYYIMNGGTWYIVSGNAETFNLGANRAYLDMSLVPALPSVSAKSLIMEVFSEEETTATGIEDVTNSDSREKVIYNLNGQRVNEADAKHGIFIINGKKVIVK